MIRITRKQKGGLGKFSVNVCNGFHKDIKDFCSYIRYSVGVMLGRFSSLIIYVIMVH